MDMFFHRCSEEVQNLLIVLFLLNPAASVQVFIISGMIVHVFQ